MLIVKLTNISISYNTNHGVCINNRDQSRSKDVHHQIFTEIFTTENRLNRQADKGLDNRKNEWVKCDLESFHYTE